MNDQYPEKITVKEMIDALQKFPPDMRIVCQGRNRGFENIFQPENILVYYNEDAMPEYEGLFDPDEIDSQSPIEVVAIFRNDMRD